MKRKTINAVITKKMSDWWQSIEDENLRNRVKANTVVTGGCIASMLLGENVNDFDVYMQDRQTAIDLSLLYVKQFAEHRRKAKGIETPIFVKHDDDRIKIVVKSAGVASEDDSAANYQYFEARPPEEAQAYIDEVMGDAVDKEAEAEAVAQDAVAPPYRPVFLSTNAISLSGKIQVVVRFVGTPAEIHANYDYVHCTNYWTKAEGVVLNQPALESLLTRELRYVGSRYPLCSVIRSRKFIQRGWTINAGQYVKMLFQLNQLDLNDVAILEDQLTGVDVAYFEQVISTLKEKGQDRVDSAYLLEIIDRMF